MMQVIACPGQFPFHKKKFLTEVKYELCSWSSGWKAIVLVNAVGAGADENKVSVKNTRQKSEKLPWPVYMHLLRRPLSSDLGPFFPPLVFKAQRRSRYQITRSKQYLCNNSQVLSYITQQIWRKMVKSCCRKTSLNVRVSMHYHPRCYPVTYLCKFWQICIIENLCSSSSFY